MQIERMRELYALADLFLLLAITDLSDDYSAASCEAPIMLQDLGLYEGDPRRNYRPTTDVEDMKETVDIESIEALKERS